MAPNTEAVTCQSCNQPTREDLVYVTMWLGGELNIIENVPAHVCAHCGEQHFDPEVEAKMRALFVAGFPRRLAINHFHVPVFSLENVEAELQPVRKSA